ncbi:MAG TPA: hypothetical protein GYA07_03830 [Verrucomicrobia bacterium]|mgnify:CR=1 FL=1|nr:hypothetical protein [Verrucomicrobiota bacterium]HOB33547.1 hypothetical protein [Verrucomicrobiota bacterium]
MRLLSVLFTFGLLFAVCKLAERLNRSRFCPAAINQAAQQASEATKAGPALVVNGYSQPDAKRYLR